MKKVCLKAPPPTACPRRQRGIGPAPLRWVGLIVIGPPPMLPLLLAAAYGCAAVGVAVMAHLRHWRKTCAPAPGEEVEEEMQPADAAQTDDQVEQQETAGKVEETQPND